MTTQLSGPQAILDPQIVAEQLEKITLDYGGHSSAVSGMCIMEAVSYVAGERFSSHPKCACPVITAFMISFNDTLPDNAARGRWIKPLIPAIVGSRVFQADGKKDKDVLLRRSLIAGDAALRCFIPFTLDIAAESFARCGEKVWAKDSVRVSTEGAATLRALPEQTSFEGLTLAARTARADLSVPADLAVLADLAVRTDLAALADIAALADLDALANFAGCAAFPSRTDLADLADQINEARVAAVLKMLAVQGNVSIANSAEKGATAKK